jgi:thymidylate synthase
MHVIDVRNTARALPAIVEYLQDSGSVESSRAGPVLVAPGPVVTVTRRPTERVLFAPVRDANIFFHGYEAIWLLAGRDDAAPLGRFVRKFGENYGEPGGVIHGAYGRRWRSAFGFDQLDAVVNILRRDPSSRQAVVQMWDCSLPGTREVDHGPSTVPGDRVVSYEDTGCNDLLGKWKDRPCNDIIMLRVRPPERSAGRDGEEVIEGPWLDLTVCCRSNDMIWGGMGANSFSFSVLLEYLAARIGVEVGVMYQVSNNAHVYVAEMERLERRALEHVTHADGPLALRQTLENDRYYGLGLIVRPMFDAPDSVDEDVRRFVGWYDAIQEGTAPLPRYENPWFRGTLERAMLAHWHHKRGDPTTALELAGRIETPDWRFACVEWLQRRQK